MIGSEVTDMAEIEYLASNASRTNNARLLKNQYHVIVSNYASNLIPLCKLQQKTPSDAGNGKDWHYNPRTPANKAIYP